MDQIDSQSLLHSIEVLKAAKALFEQPESYIAVWSGLVGAFVGAVSTYIPTAISNKQQEKKMRRSVASRLYAEIKGALLIEQCRNYTSTLSTIISLLENNQISSYRYRVEVSEDPFPVFNASLQDLGLLDPSHQVNIVMFYQLVGSLIQDVKPGGLLDSENVTVDAYRSALQIAQKAKNLGQEIMAELEKTYRL